MASMTIVKFPNVTITGPVQELARLLYMIAETSCRNVPKPTKRLSWLETVQKILDLLSEEFDTNQAVELMADHTPSHLTYNRPSIHKSLMRLSKIGVLKRISGQGRAYRYLKIKEE